MKRVAMNAARRLAAWAPLLGASVALALPAASMAAPQPQAVRVGNATIPLATLPDDKTFKSASGREISVARLKQLHAVLNAPRLTVDAKTPLHLQSLASLPPNTSVHLAPGRDLRARDLAKIATLTAKLHQPPGPKVTLPVSLKNMQPQETVGTGLTVAEALKRPGNEPIRIGSYVFTADQLRTLDKTVRSSPRDPRGLAERAPTGAVTKATVPVASLTGPRTTVSNAPALKVLLGKPDNTVVVSPHGKATTVGRIKAYLAQRGQTLDQALPSRASARPGSAPAKAGTSIPSGGK